MSAEGCVEMMVMGKEVLWGLAAGYDKKKPLWIKGVSGKCWFQF
jgi:hypothetical protein